MKAVYKYQLTLAVEVQTISLDPEARLVHAGMQDSKVTLWFEVDPKAENQSAFDYKVVATGKEWEPIHWQHIATIQHGIFIWHILQFRKLSSK